SGAIVHKTDMGAVHLGLDSPDAVRDAFTAMAGRLGDTMGGAVVQAMVQPGVETIVGITHDPSFGPLVLFGMGGVAAELLRDTALRIVPITEDRKSTRLNSSHVKNSYAVFCLKKKRK